MFGAIERRNPDAFRAGIGVSEGLAYRSARLCGIPLHLERLEAGRRLLYEINFLALRRPPEKHPCFGLVGQKPLAPFRYEPVFP